MAYIPTEWETGDVITAEKLNNIEDGIVANEGAIAEISADVVVNLTTMQPTGEVLHITGDVENIITAKVCVLHMTLYSSADDTFSNPLLKFDVYRNQFPEGGNTQVVFAGVVLMATSPAVLMAYGQISYTPSDETWSTGQFYYLTVQS